MPEIDANELRRLRRLQGRLERAAEKSRADTAEKRDLTRRLRAAESRSSDLSGRVAALVEENRRLAAQPEGTSADVESLRRSGEEARRAIDVARAEARSATEEKRKLEEASRSLQSERDRFRARAETAEARPEQEGKIAILPPRR